MSNTIDIDIETVLAHYLIAALWSSTHPDTEEPLDDDYDASDIHESALATSRADVEAFIESVGDLDLAEYEAVALQHGRDQMLGHDLWLTRNGHGAGFGTRGAGEVGEQLDRLASAMMGVDFYPGDDGALYLM